MKENIFKKTFRVLKEYKLVGLRRGLYLALKRKKLKNKAPTILSIDCVGGGDLSRYGFEIYKPHH